MMMNDIKVAKKRDFGNVQQQIQGQMSLTKGKLGRLSIKHLDNNPAFGIRQLSKPSKSRNPTNNESIHEMDED